MKIIDLLVKISNKEEVTYKLRCLNEIWYYDKANGNYKNAVFEDLFKVLYSKLTIYGLLSYEVEIIEEKPKKIEQINFRNEKGETLIGANMWEFYYKLEKLRNAVNYLLKKEDE